MTLDILKTNQLFAKRSKCRFGCQELDYLGHIVSPEGVKADPSKIQSMLDWLLLTNIKSLRGFLRLTGYYRRFIKGYGIIAALLNALLRKNAFKWSLAATEAFQELKDAVTQPPGVDSP